MMRFLVFCLAVAWSLNPIPAWSQSTPNWQFGYVPPASEWNALWASKQDANGRVSFADNKTASIIADAAGITGLSQSGTPAQTIYNQSVLSGNATTFNGYDALRGVSVAPALSTVNTITGVAGYTLNNTVPIGQRSQTVALFGVGTCAANGSQCWGVDTIVSDNPSLVNTGITTGGNKFLTNEHDLNITDASTTGNGLAIGGTALPTSVTLGINGVAVNKLWGAGGVGTGTALFANGLITADACCATGLNIGASALSGSTVSSQPITQNYFDSGGVYRNITLTALGGKLFLGGTAAAGYATASSNGTVNGLILGSQGGSGTNIASQFALWDYFDAGGVAQNYNMQVNASRTFVFASSVGNSVANFDFEGGISVKGNTGVTCAPGSPTASFQTVNGLVVHC
jgi:hypothetical protein